MAFWLLVDKNSSSIEADERTDAPEGAETFETREEWLAGIEKATASLYDLGEELLFLDGINEVDPSSGIIAQIEMNADTGGAVIEINNDSDASVKVHTKIDPGRDRSNTIPAGKTKKHKIEKITEKTFVEVRMNDKQGQILASVELEP